jgi:hypothetical protein
MEPARPKLNPMIGLSVLPHWYILEPSVRRTFKKNKNSRTDFLCIDSEIALTFSRNCFGRERTGKRRLESDCSDAYDTDMFRGVHPLDDI